MLARRRVHAVFVGLVLSLVGATPAAASQTTLNFDALSSGTVLGTQFDSQGIDFGQGPAGAEGGSWKVAAEAAGVPASAPNDVALNPGCVRGEFPSSGTDVWLRFRKKQSGISMAAGHDADVNLEDPKLTLEIYDDNGAKLGQTSATTGTGTHTALSLQLGAANTVIRFVHLVASTAGCNQFAIDDLSFNKIEASDPPIPPDFGLSRVESGNVTLRAGTSQTVKLKVGRFDGSTGAITISAPPLPAKVTSDLPKTFTGASGDTVDVTFTAPADAPPASLASLTITGTPTSSAGTQAHTVGVPLRVQGTYRLVARSLSVQQAVGTEGAAALGTDHPEVSFGYFGPTLVAHNTTWARFSVSAAVASDANLGVDGVTARLAGFGPDGAPLPGSPLAPVHDGRAVKAYTESVASGGFETDPDGPFTFQLPSSWTAAGTITLRATASAPTPAGILLDDDRPLVPCGTDCASVSASRTGVPFKPTTPFKITYATVHYTRGGADQRPPGSLATWLAEARATLPISDEDFSVSDLGGSLDATSYANPPYLDAVDDKGNHYDANGDGEDPKNNATLELLRAYVADRFSEDAGVDLGSVTLGFVDNLARGVATSYIYTGYAKCDDVPPALLKLPDAARKVAVALFCAGSRNARYRIRAQRTAVVDVYRPLTSVAHEIGHALGRSHADQECDGELAANGGSDPGWPNSRGFFDDPGALGLDPYGTVAADGSLSVATPPLVPVAAVPTRVLPGASTYDFMSYCAKQEPDAWISPRGWEQAYAYLASAHGRAAARAATADPAPAGATLVSKPVLGEHVVGHFVDGRLVLDTVEQRPGILTGAAGSPYSLRALDDRGKPLASVPMTMETGHADLGPGSGPHPTLYVQADVPAANGTSGVQVLEGGKVVAKRMASKHAPTVKLKPLRLPRRYGPMTPIRIRYTVRDKDKADRGKLLVSVELSKDGGRHFTTIAVGAGLHGTRARGAAFGKARHAVLRVRATDGFRQGLATAKVVAVKGFKPRVMILDGVTSPRVDQGATVTLNGQAYDDAGTKLTGLGWYDGAELIGRGGVVSTTSLAPGVHHLRLVARDALGRVGEGRRRVVVRAALPRFAGLRVLGAADGRTTLRVASTVAATLTGPGLRARVGPAARTVHVDGDAGAAVTLRLRGAAGRTSTLRLVLRRSA